MFTCTLAPNPTIGRKNMGRLTGKVAVITGANSGIGLASAKRFAAEGAKVFMCGRRQEELNAAVAQVGGNARGIQADVSKLADLDRLFDIVKQEAGSIDVLFANAGGGTFAPLGSITEEQFDSTFATNVKGTLFTVQKALPLLKDGALQCLESRDPQLRPMLDPRSGATQDSRQRPRPRRHLNTGLAWIGIR
jgi:NAD(P)-dependent dehydrogenase (short-subunit alcohol dehydrogenase family)